MRSTENQWRVGKVKFTVCSGCVPQVVSFGVDLVLESVCCGEVLSVGVCVLW
jgi:hypothetical protein